jgi:hypothetical protein
VTTRYPVEVGQRYRAVSVPGGSLPVVWEVVAIYMPWQSGFEHARLRSVDIRAETMTLASSVVADRARFTRID